MKTLERHLLLAIDQGQTEAGIIDLNKATMTLLATEGFVSIDPAGVLALTRKGREALDREIAVSPFSIRERGFFDRPDDSAAG